MKAVRQDAWSADDDLLLAEVTLRHIREGSTQLHAFEEVGDKLGRTSAACGFRWNSFVRKQYEAAIQIAKAQRQKQKKMKLRQLPISESISTSISTEEISIRQDDLNSFEQVIHFMRNVKTIHADLTRKVSQLEREYRRAEEELQHARRENEQLKKQFTSSEVNYKSVNEDYKTLLQIMDRARKMSLLVDPEEEKKPIFKMDANGNLERINR